MTESRRHPHQLWNGVGTGLRDPRVAHNDRILPTAVVIPSDAAFSETQRMIQRKGRHVLAPYLKGDDARMAFLRLVQNDLHQGSADPELSAVRAHSEIQNVHLIAHQPATDVAGKLARAVL